MNRYEKYEWLEQTCSEKFMKEEFVLELLHWVGEDDFEEFYDRLCRLWDIAKSPEALRDEEEDGEEKELEYTIGCR